MQSTSSRIWNRVTMSISNDDNNYTTDTSLNHKYIDASNIMLSQNQKELLNLSLNCSLCKKSIIET